MKTDSLTILMIDKYYFIKGGAERYYFELKAVLEAEGHRVVPFSMQHPENETTRFEKYFVSQIEFHAQGRFQKLITGLRSLGRILYSIEARVRLAKLISEVKPDIAHLHMIDHQISPSILHTLKRFRIPVIQTVHQYKIPCANYLFYIFHKSRVCTRCLDGNPFHPLTERCHKGSLVGSAILVLETLLHRMLKIYRLVDVFHVPSRFMGEMIHKGGIPQRKIVHHNYCIRLEDFPYSKESDPYYVFLGRLSPEKGVHTLLEAVRSIPEMPLKIIGDGPEREKLEKLADTHESEHVSFEGFVSKEEIVRLVSRARFVVIPSEWFDNSPLVIYESFALGKPVIAADIGGMAELIDHGRTGFKFPAGDASKLSEQIQKLISDESLCAELGANARQKAENMFSGPVHYRFILDLYLSMLNRR